MECNKDKISNIMNGNKRSGSHEMSHDNAKEDKQMNNGIILDSGSAVNLFFNTDLV